MSVVALRESALEICKSKAVFIGFSRYNDDFKNKYFLRNHNSFSNIDHETSLYLNVKFEVLTKDVQMMSFDLFIFVLNS